MLFAGLTYIISQFHSRCCPSVTTACPFDSSVSSVNAAPSRLFHPNTNAHTHTSSGPFIRLDSERGPEPWGLTLNLTVTLQILSWRRRVLHLLLSFKTLNSLSPWNVRPIKKSQGFEFFFCLDRDLLCTTRKSCRDEIKRKSLILFLSVPLQMFPLKRNCKYFLCGLFCWYTTSQAFLMLSELVPTTIHTLWHTHTDTHMLAPTIWLQLHKAETHMLEYLTLSVCVFLRRHTIGSICVKMPAAADFGFRANPRSAFGVERRSAARSCFIPGRNSRLHVCVWCTTTPTHLHTPEKETERELIVTIWRWVFRRVTGRSEAGVWGEAGMISCSVVCSGRLESVFWGPLRQTIIYPLHLLFMFHWSFRQTHPSSLCGTVLRSLTGTRLPPRIVFLSYSF